MVSSSQQLAEYIFPEPVSGPDAARLLLADCLAGRKWREDLLATLLQKRHTSLLFRTVIEGLSDRFDPRLCDVYADLFAEILERTCHGLRASDLRERYERVRRPRRFLGNINAIKKVFVLSRVTIGADVAVTSVFLCAARQFPNAEVYFVAPIKAWELFGGKPGIRHLPVNYERYGSLADRLSDWPSLRKNLSRGTGNVIIDPDSRLTQLGLLPVCPEEDYFFFESRSYGGESSETLSSLASRWVKETFGTANAAPFIQPVLPATVAPEITVSFGVGGNREKQVADPFERELVAYLSRSGASVVIDCGAGGEEEERARKTAASCPGNVFLYKGAFTGFATMIASSRLYIGYDSAGGHVAAASGVPMVSIFAGFPCDRMFDRWRPSGHDKIHIVRVAHQEPETVLQETFKAVAGLVDFSQAPRSVICRPD